MHSGYHGVITYSYIKPTTSTAQSEMLFPAADSDDLFKKDALSRKQKRLGEYKKSP